MLNGYYIKTQLKIFLLEQNVNLKIQKVTNGNPYIEKT